MTDLQQRHVPSPIGRLRLVASSRALVGLYFGDPLPDSEPRSDPLAARGPQVPGEGPDHGPEPYPEAHEHALLDRAAAQLREYFAGTRRSFDVPVSPRGTEFQRAVWTALADIEYGQTRSYGELAAVIGRPSAARAVGAANGRNPLSLVLPCHRVIGSGGALTGYAGGLERKRWLLAHERGVLTLV
ncbi:Methylated-DNA--protein-cysteine methyltransferase [Enhygromyxa salina]|uniref:Methylated-DNA--protein-cysteine methyltransferase n=1 Tax=Enhygromyxa salina TaxID=215803 RepID=A0A2S9XCZ5_9BACT|nr:methylated-DNA--[protein]-cysteine S-methyltransferase [Enhygromyxa salina]PRP90734.1 Methylated-DNA--protein-cysteine methyltransferase [Enhygromyxa salina]